MKKLFTLISFLAFFSLIFIGCQSTEDITSPVGSLVKPKPVYYFFDCGLTAVNKNETAIVDLVAGQHNPVGTATFHKTTEGLEITYQLDAGEIAAGAVITEVHIDFATELNNDAKNGGFHANSSGNPSPGLFDLNESPVSGATSW
ncbi:MAG: hypothetical protein MUP85_09505, partial [Candidatus Lokiarchaeota archaeon]|nr:hypothetical protein [Candidatus Lokiarchaeota archaeon]